MDLFIKNITVLDYSLIEILWIILFAIIIFSDVISNLYALVGFIIGHIILVIVGDIHTKKIEGLDHRADR